MRFGAAQDMLSEGSSIGQIMAKVGWSKVDKVMRYVGIGNIDAMNSPNALQSEPRVYKRPQNLIRI
jgi:hypothetical protein